MNEIESKPTKQEVISKKDYFFLSKTYVYIFVGLVAILILINTSNINRAITCADLVKYQSLLNKSRSEGWNEGSLLMLDNKTKEINIILANNAEVVNELKTQYSGLEQNYFALDKDHTTLNKEYSGLKQETNNLIADIDIYKKSIEESLEWYKQNSLLDNSIEQQKVKEQIASNCFEINGNECRIKLGCFYFINSEKLHLEYQTDYSLYSKKDKISSINKFITNAGGDCEDYSLFFKAEYNYAIEQCNGKKIILEGLEFSKDSSERYWVNFQKTWYLDNVVKIEITGYIFSNIVCGTMYDPISKKSNGHCIIALSNKKIESISDLELLDNSYLIEPQDGSYLGNLNKKNSAIYLINKDRGEDDSITSWIDTLITDEDFYLFNNETLWQSYNSFNNLLDVQKNKIQNKVNSQ